MKALLQIFDILISYLLDISEDYPKDLKNTNQDEKINQIMRYIRPQPKIGGNETSALSIQTPAIINESNLTLRIGAYLNG
jgi:hypothetical protein